MNVEYELSLKDRNLSSGIKSAEGHVNHFEKSLEKTQERAAEFGKEVRNSILGAFGVFAGVEFIKSSTEAYNSVEKSLASLRAGLKSTGGVAGETMEDLTHMGTEFSENLIGKKEVWLDAEAQVLSFHDVSSGVFEDVMKNIADVAAKTGNSVHETSIMMGKAFNDPIRGLGALRRVGVEFDKSQEEIIKKLVLSGHLLEAQRIMVEAINKDYGGTAKAMAETDAGKVELLKQQFDEVKESIGKLVMEEAVRLTPTIKGLIEDVRHFTEWLNENKNAIRAVGKVIVDVAAYTFVLKKAWAAFQIGKSAVARLSAFFLTGIESETKALQTETLAYNELTGAIERSNIAKTQSATIGTVAATESAAAVGVGEAAIVGTAAGATTGAAGAAAAGGILSEESAALAGATGLTVAGGALLVTIAAGSVLAIADSLSHVINGKSIFDGKSDGLKSEKVAKGYVSVAGKYYKEGEEGDAFTSLKEVTREEATGKMEYDDALLKTYKSLKNATEPFLKHLYEQGKVLEAERKKHAHKESSTVNLEALKQKTEGGSVKNYNIHIGTLGKIDMNVKNLTESKPDIKRYFTELLTAALNDAEIGGE